MSKQVWLNGKLVPADQASVSVFDHGLLYGDGVFEGIRAYAGRIFKLKTHLGRLYASAASIRLDIPYNPAQLTDAIRETIQANKLSDTYIRLCVTRGKGPLGINPFTCSNPSVFIIADTITMYPRDYYDNGMRIIIAKTIRNHPAALSPAIKSMNYLNNILAKTEAVDAGTLEAIMLNHNGQVAECTGDNIFIVKKNDAGENELITPTADAGVLEGVTMNCVLDLAKEAGIKTRRTDFGTDVLYQADEVFLTGTAAEIIPVTKINDTTIGAGVPGPVTLKLHSAFHQLVSKNAPED